MGPQLKPEKIIIDKKRSGGMTPVPDAVSSCDGLLRGIGIGGGVLALALAVLIFFLLADADRPDPVASEGNSPSGSAPVVPPQPSPPAAQPLMPEAVLPEQGKEQAQLQGLAQEEEIHRLLNLAEDDLAALRLTSPAENNALMRYEQVLAMDDQNEQAGKGIARIVAKYIALAEVELGRNGFSNARGYHARALAIEPDAASVQALGVRIEQRAEIEQKKQDLVGEFVTLPGGCFQMGSPVTEKGRTEDEGPQHEVCVDTVQMGRYEVTVGQWRKFMQGTDYKTDAERNDGGSEGCHSMHEVDGSRTWEYVNGRYWDKVGFKQADDFPVVCLSWNDIQVYLQWLNTKTGSLFRLPTEAEWEYAARGGTGTSRFWGDNPDAACTYGNVTDQTTDGDAGWSKKHDCTDRFYSAAPVGAFQPNPYGLYDMLGNVLEWCQDRFSNAYYLNSPRDNPQGSLSGAGRVSRGGSWSNSPRRVRAADRQWYWPDRRNDHLGFRLVLSPDQ